MDLFERFEFEIACAESGLEETAIFEDVFAGVPFHEAEIEDFLRFAGTHTAGTGAEAMNEPRKLEERG